MAELFRERGRRRTCRATLSIALILAQFGCTPTYDIRCFSEPSGATVTVREQVKGTTPCEFTVVPKGPDAPDGRLEVTFVLPDGRQKKEVVLLKNARSAGNLGQAIGKAVGVVGLVLAVPYILEHGDDDSQSDTSSDDDSGVDALAAVGLGVMLAGGGIYCLAGGTEEKGNTYEIRVAFPQASGHGLDHPLPADS